MRRQIFVITLTYSCLSLADVRLYNPDTDAAQVKEMCRTAADKDTGLLSGLGGADTASNLALFEPYLTSKNYTTLVDVKENHIRGFIIFTTDGVIADLYDYTDMSKLAEKVRTGGIQLLLVDEGHRRQGLGRALLTEAIQQMESHGIIVISLMTTTNNAAAQALYEKYGFKMLFSDATYSFYQRRTVKTVQ